VYRSKSPGSTQERTRRGADVNQRPVGLDKAERLAQVFAMRVRRIQAEQTDGPESIGKIILRLACQKIATTKGLKHEDTKEETGKGQTALFEV